LIHFYKRYKLRSRRNDCSGRERMENIRFLFCLAIFSLGVDLVRQERMRREIRRELKQEKFANLGLSHPSTLPFRQRLLVYWNLGSF